MHDLSSDHGLAGRDHAGKIAFDAALTDRQWREQAFHRTYAEENRAIADTPVGCDVVESRERRPWNAYWSCYDALKAQDLAGKRVMLPGCGFGDDAIRLAMMGAEVHASDLSADVVAIAQARAAKFCSRPIDFGVMPAETTAYPDSFFDLVFFNDILHHADIPGTIREVRRVLKPNGAVVANELYTHSSIQAVRDSRFVKDVVYPRMSKFIYGTSKPYITEDEHKIDESELGLLTDVLQPGFDMTFFYIATGRLFPNTWRRVMQMDRAVLSAIGGTGRLLAARVVVSGRLAP